MSDETGMSGRHGARQGTGADRRWGPSRHRRPGAGGAAHETTRLPFAPWELCASLLCISHTARRSTHSTAQHAQHDPHSRPQKEHNNTSKKKQKK